MSKIGRNSPCDCGSGIKFKKCCLTSLLKIDKEAIEFNKKRSAYNKMSDEEKDNYQKNMEVKTLEDLNSKIFYKVPNPIDEDFEKNDVKPFNEAPLAYREFLSNYRKNNKIEGQTEFTFEQVLNDSNIRTNFDGIIATSSNYQYEFSTDENADMILEWSVINNLIKEKRGVKYEE